MWTLKTTAAIGGLENIGYIPTTDYLLVLSSNGESLFDCLTGERIHRISNRYEWNSRLDETNMTIAGVNGFNDAVIPICGLHGFNPLKDQVGEWKLEFDNHRVQITAGAKSIKHIYDFDICEMRAVGFSETGRSFVVASSCDLVIYSAIY